jgi:hypothetical protein
MTKIRKLAALVLIVLSWSSYSEKANAQNPSSYYVEDPRTFFGGLLLGANFSQVDGDSYAGYHKVGLNAGGIVYTQFDEHLALSLEILFSQKGSRGHKVQESGNQGTYITAYKIDLNYAEVPVQICYFDRRRSHAGAGFSYSQLITSKETIETNPADPLLVGTDLNKTYPFRKADLNFILGGNLHLIKGLFLNARFQYSLIPIRKNIPPGYGRSEQFNNLWTVRLMYLF